MPINKDYPSKESLLILAGFLLILCLVWFTSSYLSI